jgi:hypothetical protein
VRWVQWLEVEQPHLVWMRAKRYCWRDISIRFACDRTTAWRRWKDALGAVAVRLNNVQSVLTGRAGQVEITVINC